MIPNVFLKVRFCGHPYSKREVGEMFKDGKTRLSSSKDKKDYNFLVIISSHCHLV